MTTQRFSLLHDAWLPCMLADGTISEVGLLELFAQPKRYLRLMGDSPPQTFAVLGVLLAIKWCAHRDHPLLERNNGPDRFLDWWLDEWQRADSGEPDARSIEYLNRYADRFELFGPTPFMQVADLESTSGDTLPVSRLVSESESTYFTLRAGKSLETLAFSEAARWLITVQAYDYSGIKTGAKGDPRVKGGKGYPIGTGWSGMTGGVIIHGDTIAETLMLNSAARFVFNEDRQNDVAVWERDPDTAKERPSMAPTGPRDLVTWQSRRVRLFAQSDVVVSVLVANGDRIPEAGANEFGDPRTPYRFSKNKSTKSTTVFYPRPHDANRTVWTTLEPLLAREGIIRAGASASVPQPKPPATILQLCDLREAEDIDYRRTLDIELVSVSYGSQSSSITNTIDAHVELPTLLFDASGLAATQALLAAAQMALEASVEFGRFAGMLVEAAGGDYAFQASEQNKLLSALESKFQEWIVTLTDVNMQEMLREWGNTLMDVTLEHARVLVQSSGPRALVGSNVTDGERTHSISSATAFLQLRRRLQQILPGEINRKEADKDA